MTAASIGTTGKQPAAPEPAPTAGADTPRPASVGVVGRQAVPAQHMTPALEQETSRARLPSRAEQPTDAMRHCRQIADHIAALAEYPEPEVMKALSKSGLLDWLLSDPNGSMPDAPTRQQFVMAVAKRRGIGEPPPSETPTADTTPADEIDTRPDADEPPENQTRNEL